MQDDAVPMVAVPVLTAERINVELALLREFHAAWVDLHATPRDKAHRRKMEAQAQLLVDRAHAVAAYQQSYPHEPAHA